jgi:hypothetical protein
VTPPVFIGVVGVDFLVSQMEEIGTSSYVNVLNEIKSKSRAACLSPDKSVCMLQALRKGSGWTDGCGLVAAAAGWTAGEACASEVNVEPLQCPGSTNMDWLNTDNEDKQDDDIARTCCLMEDGGDSDAWSNTCKVDADMMTMLMTLGGVGVFLGCVVLMKCTQKKKAVGVEPGEPEVEAAPAPAPVVQPVPVQAVKVAPPPQPQVIAPAPQPQAIAPAPQPQVIAPPPQPQMAVAQVAQPVMMQQPMGGTNYMQPMGGTNYMQQPMQQQPMQGMGMPMQGMQQTFQQPQQPMGGGYMQQQPMQGMPVQPMQQTFQQPVQLMDSTGVQQTFQ